MSFAEPRAILFDLDETIIDFGSNVDEAWRQACQGATQHVDSLDPGELYEAVGDTRDWLWADSERHAVWRMDMRAVSAEIVRLAMASIGHEVDPSVARAVADHYRDMRDASYVLNLGAVETFERMRARGCRLALVTNGSGAAQRWKIERFDLERYFAHVHIEGEHGYGKPDPRAYQTTQQALDVAPADAWFVGDNLEWDVIAPKQMGMYAVWVNHGGTLPTCSPAVPDLTISSISELP